MSIVKISDALVETDGKIIELPGPFDFQGLERDYPDIFSKYSRGPSKVLSLKDLIISLFITEQPTANTTLAEHLTNHATLTKVNAATDEVLLDSGEIETIKKMLVRKYNSWIVGQVVNGYLENTKSA